MTYNSRKPKNPFTKMTIKLVSLGTDRFDSGELIELLKEIRFDLININLSTSKEDVGIRGRGFVPIGFVNKFYINEDGQYAFDVAVSSKFAETIEGMKEEDSDIGITARVFTNREGKITKIIGLDLISIISVTE